jgi:gamma-glutamyltranspeptidase/glutathione hydrolase
LFGASGGHSVTYGMTMTTRPELVGTFGMVASTHWLASAAGMAALERGGNAFDAAVAAALTLQVVEPHMCGPAGEAPILIYSRRVGEPLVVCGQGPAPRAATIAAFRELGFDAIPGTGLLAACVPGAFDAFMLLLRDHGRLRLADVMAFPIYYAEHGFPAVAPLVRTIEAVADLFRTSWRLSAALWLRGGRPPRVGTLIRNPQLACTFRRIVAEAEAWTTDREGQIQRARDVFLRGFVAEAIDAHLRVPALDTSGRRHSGLMSGADLAAYAATVERPTTLDYRGHTVCKTAFWGQGPVMLQLLALLDGFDLEAMGRDSGTFVHTVVECMKLAFADREAWYGDGAPPGDLLDPAYAAERRRLVGHDASLELRPGAAAAGSFPWLPHIEAAPAGALAGVGEPTSGDTTHVDVVDAEGNMVSATPSGGWLQSSPAIRGLGFALGTRAQMLWLTEGHPNALAPGKRPRTTLTPTLVLREGQPYLALGTPGGDCQDQWSPLMLLSHLHFGMNLQEAIDAPAFHTNHFPNSFYPHAAAPGEVEIEARFSPPVFEELRRRGHRVRVANPWSLGRLSAVSRTPDGVLRGAANPRGMQGYATGR